MGPFRHAANGDLDIGWERQPRHGGPWWAAGALASQFVRGTDGELRRLPAAGSTTLLAGERLVSRSTAGGGYGEASEREPRRVALDVKERWITPERARAVYRVSVNSAGEVDWAESARLRSGAK
jgi:N-methylhydantoinase B